MSLGELWMFSHLAAQSKVSQFDMAALIDEDIRGFDVSMQYSAASAFLICGPIMAIF